MHNGVLDQLLQKEIQPMSWSPLGSFFKEANQTNTRIKKVLDTFTKKYNVTEDQLLLSWILKMLNLLFINRFGEIRSNSTN